MGTVDITVVLVTYNHVETVRNALESIFSQITNYSYEVLCVDDASNDGTQELLKEYRRKFPDKVRLFIRHYNNGFPTKNVYLVLSKYARGKYISIIEGDDYWIDNGKLQKQYDFLECNNRFSAVFSDVKTVDEKGEEWQDYCPYVRKDNSIFTLSDYTRLECPGMLVSGMFRNFYLQEGDYSISYRADFMMGDMVRYAILLIKGDIYQMPETTAVYRHIRKKGGSSFNSINLENKTLPLRYLRYWIRIENYLMDHTNGIFKLKIIDEQINNIAAYYSTKDLWIAVKETRRKYRIPRTLILHMLMKNCKHYKKKSNKNDIFSWHKFMKCKRPVILFGAGDLAADYLDRYSWRKPVLFIVDNDHNKIGKSYKGHMIKNPSEIKHFKEKAVVLITNEKNEEEIAKQLNSMGIKNIYSYYTMQGERIKNIILDYLIK